MRMNSMIVLIISICLTIIIAGCNSQSNELTGQAGNSGLCRDGIDNDLDGLTDYPSDPGCNSKRDSTEIGTNQCDDGTDNDGDTKKDFGNAESKDSKCSSVSDADESPRDFCSDSDGARNYFTIGTVSGEDSSVPFSNTDFCLSSTTLREYYCGNKLQDFNSQAEDHVCALNGNSTGNQTCNAGRCL